MSAVRYSSKIPAMVASANPKANMVIRKGTLDLLAMSRQRVPVKTGHLKNNSFVQMGDLEGRVVYAADYAFYVEGGTRKMDAQPYLRPAFDVLVPDIVRALMIVMQP